MAGRAGFNSRLGFIMAAVGSAVGLGNLWKFPYVASQNGGAVFVLLYLVFLFLIGIPALFAELSIGRRQQKDVVHAFGFDKKGRSYSWIGFVFIGTAVLLLSYYAVIAGWAINYAFNAFTAPYFQDADGYFGALAVSPKAVYFHALMMLIVVLILIRGVGKGIEKANMIMMPVLFATVVGLAIYGLFQPGAWAGVEFYLKPDFSAYKSFSSISTVMNEAAGQTFFSIGLGIGTMLTYSSYISRDNNLQSTGFTIGFADTAVAVLAGLMVFPLMFSLGLQDMIATDSSVGGLFIIIPSAFAKIGGTLGGIMAGGFFIMLSFAAISSALSLLEVPISYMVERFPQWGRARVVVLMGLAVYILGLPSAIWLDWLSFADALVSNILLLFGGLLLVVYVGWIKPDTLEELDVGAENARINVAKAYRAIIKYPLPVFLSILLLLGVINFFASL